ncbi:MAG: hypothetical protein GXX90_09140 [Microbacteriaceae bacterium]|nr:hypothetical protein [Microbacteriaceae bacterium]
MFGWLRSLTKRTTIVDDDRLVLSAPALPEHPLAAPATAPVEHDDESRPLHRDGASPIRAAAAAAAARAHEPAPAPAFAEPADFALPAEFAEPARPADEHGAGRTAEHGTGIAADSAFDAPPQAPAQAEAPAQAQAPAPAETAAPLAETAETAVGTAPPEETAAEPAEPEHPAFDGIVPAPSQRPAMPLSAHPNFAGLDLAVWEPSAPRLLEPEAALTPAAQQELLKLFDDLFGPAGRYRLEWRTDRRVGDDAFFAEIMTADLVRRVQNTIADVAELDRVEPPKRIVRRREITAGPSSVAPDAIARDGDADLPKAS